MLLLVVTGLAKVEIECKKKKVKIFIEQGKLAKKIIKFLETFSGGNNRKDYILVIHLLSVFIYYLIGVASKQCNKLFGDNAFCCY